MNAERPDIILREMTVDDIDQVMVLDKMAFPTPWPARTFRYEGRNNIRSTMIVLERAVKAARDSVVAISTR